MSATIDKRLVTEQHLLDIIDDEWLKDTLPDDFLQGVTDKVYTKAIKVKATKCAHASIPNCSYFAVGVGALVPLPEGLEAAPEGLDEEKLSKGIQGKPERWNEPGLLGEAIPAPLEAVQSVC
eukprot:scaffold97894_cov22-Tisochrysis_lutea.AAC.1